MAGKEVHIRCGGRGPTGVEVFSPQIDVTIEVSKKRGIDYVNVQPKNCCHSVDDHAQRCKASHPDQDRVGDGVLCPFSFDYPHATAIPGWKTPSELVGVLREVCPL